MTRRLRILFVEDSEDDVLLLLRHLRKEGYEVSHRRVESAEALAAALEDAVWDMILCDCKLPKLEPIAALEQVMERDPDLPFIAVSGTVPEEQLVRLMRAGARDVVLKDRLVRLGPAIERELEETVIRRERQRSLQALRESQDLLQTIVDHVPAEILLKGTDGCYDLVNRELTRRYNVKQEEIEGKTVYDLYPQEAADDAAAADRKVLATRQTIVSEEVLPCADGDCTNLVVRFPVLDEDGQVVKIGVFAADITELKAAELALEESEERYKALYNRTPAMLHSIDAEGRLTSVSDYWLERLGYERGEVIGRKSTEFLTEQSRRYAEEVIIPDFMRTGSCKDVNYQIVKQNGEVIDVLVSATSEWDDSGQFLRSLAVLVDVTEQRAAEAQLRQAQKMEAVGQLAGGMAHDFNNILAVLIGNLQLLDRALKGDERQHRRVSTSLAAAQRGATLTQRILAFARSQTLEPVVVDVRQSIDEFSDLLRQSLGKGIELDLGCAEGLWPIEIDPGQLENALLNLAVNARDAMPGGGCLSIRAENVSLAGDGPEGLSGDVVVLRVSDTGEGMPPEVLERVLEPFFTTKPAGKGTGLGLSMVYGFVEQSGGKLEIESAVGGGTTIRIYLPRAEGEPEVREGVNGVADPTPGGATILLVEDEADLRDTAAEFLRELGYEVIEADSGASALAALNANGHIDLLFTDIVMPGELDGFGLARNICKRFPRLKVLYTSGYTDARLLGDEGIGVSAFLRKPYMNKDLAGKLRELLDAA